MVAEAVGFMMPRAADGGAMAPELVTRDFLGGCQAPAPAADDPRHDAAVMVRSPPRPMLCSVSLSACSLSLPLLLVSLACPIGIGIGPYSSL
ncbi:hypothetical protein ACQJBY_031151 [Aegilops geniculata]